MTAQTHDLRRPRSTFDLEITLRTVMRNLRALPGAPKSVIRSGSQTLSARANGDGHAEGESGVLSPSEEAFS
jgi:hypothetical protein